VTVLTSLLHSQAYALSEAQAINEQKASPQGEVGAGPVLRSSSLISLSLPDLVTTAELRGAFFRLVLGMSPQTALALSFRIDYYCAIWFTLSYACLCGVILNPHGSDGVKFLTVLLVVLGSLLAAAGFFAAVYLLRRWRGRNTSAFKPGALLRYLAYAHHGPALSAM